jgi:hypothetical protein
MHDIEASTGKYELNNGNKYEQDCIGKNTLIAFGRV